MGRFAGTDTISRTPGALKITWLPPRPGLRHSMNFCSATACRSSVRQPTGFLLFFWSVLPAATKYMIPYPVSVERPTGYRGARTLACRVPTPNIDLHWNGEVPEFMARSEDQTSEL